MFTALLMCPVADLGAVAKGQKKKCDITIADVIGPLDATDTSVDFTGALPRDANFSLLSYSFSLVGSMSLEREEHTIQVMCVIMRLHLSRLPPNLPRAEPGAAPRAKLRDGPGALGHGSPFWQQSTCAVARGPR